MDLGQLGIPSEDEVIEQYCSHTHIPDISGEWSLYLAFTFFRVAAILQGVYKRALQSEEGGKGGREGGGRWVGGGVSE